MRRLLLLSICLLLASAAPVSADLINVTGVTTTGTLEVKATVDQSDSGFDVWDIYVTNIEEDKQAIIDVFGAWSATGGQFKVFTGAATTANWKKFTTIDDGGATYSTVNFSAYIAAGDNHAAPAGWAREAGTTGNWSNLIEGAWYNNQDDTENIAVGADDTDSDGYTEDLLGQFRVSKGTTKITFTGTGNDGIGYADTSFEETQFSVTIPEPSTLALLGCGLFGLLAYAWRKRK